MRLLFVVLLAGSAKTFDCPKLAEFPTAEKSFVYRPKGGGRVELHCPRAGEWSGLRLDISEGRSVYSEAYLAEGGAPTCVALSQQWDFDEPNESFPPEEAEGRIRDGNLIERRHTTYEYVEKKDGKLELKSEVRFLGAPGKIHPLERAKSLRDLCERFAKTPPGKGEEGPRPLNIETFTTADP